MKKHNERCKVCKTRIKELLHQLFGEVIENHDLNIPSRLEDYMDSEFRDTLSNIYTNLQDYRGHKNFVKSDKLKPVDFFVPNPGFIIEFDESQHFTKPREIALSHYSDKISVKFDKYKWISLCDTLNKKDNDPIYRDEQRAWYDTLRDFAPSILHIDPTIRLFASDYIWCSFDANNKDDQIKFKKILGV